MQKWIAAGVLFATITWGSEVAGAAALTCPAPPAQFARDVGVETRGKLAGLVKLGVLELENKTQVVVKPLLEKTPNSDRLVMAQMLTSIFCQVLSNSTMGDADKFDRLAAFNNQMTSLLLATHPKEPAAAAPRPSVTPRTEARPTRKMTAIGRGSSVTEVGEYLRARRTDWQRDKANRFTVSFSRVIDDIPLTAHIAFDESDRATRHWMSADAERTTGKAPRIIGEDPRELCAAAPRRLSQQLTQKLGAPIQPLVETSREMPGNWALVRYARAQCSPEASKVCRMDARVVTNQAAFQSAGSRVLLKVELVDAAHARAKAADSRIYTKTSTTCEVRIEDPDFAYLKVLDPQ